MNARLVFVHALTPLHPGIGQGLGVIDLPIAREKATNLPYLPGSSLKGTLRAACDDPKARRLVFGPDTVDADAHAGAAVFSDQRLLLIPIRSMAGTFAWVTSPYVLRRFARDARTAALAQPLPDAVPQPASLERCQVPADASAIVAGNQVCLEDLDLVAAADATAGQWASFLAQRIFPTDEEWQQMLVARFCVVHDDVLSFLLETATQVAARVKLQEKAKTVQPGALWYEEALPVETILAGLVVVSPTKELSAEGLYQKLSDLTSRTLQLGGKATVGRGLCEVRVTE